MPAPDPSAAARGQAQSSNSDQTSSFEESLAALGDTVMRLESGTLGLSDSIAAYERGVTILRRLHEELAAAEERVSVLVRIDEDGRPVLGPLPREAGESAAGQPPKRPGSRAASGTRKPSVKTLPGMDDAEGDA